MTIRQHQTAAPVESILAPHPTVFPVTTTAVTVSGTSYAFALPVTAYPRLIMRALFNVSGAGSGAVVGEVAIGTSPASVLSSATVSATITPQIVQSLGSVSLISTGFRNVAIGAGYTVAAGTQAWLMFRTAVTIAQPTFPQLSGMAGFCGSRSLAASGVLTVGSGLSFTATTVSVPAIMLASV